MRVRRGVQAEVLFSLALVMITGTVLFAAIFVRINHARIESLHGILGRGFVAEIQLDLFDLRPVEGGLWWHIDADGRVQGVNALPEALDDETRRLAQASFDTGEALVESSAAPWDPIRFAAPTRHASDVIAGRIDAPVSGLVLTGFVVVEILIFGFFGITLLRRRVVGPLHRLSRAVREMGEGGVSGNVPIEGVGEIESLARSFNEMQAALAARTGALEKAVHELRESNAHLLQARDGLDRAERLAMVGSLAAGVAHEVGNPMGALLAFLDVAGRDEGLGAESRRCLARATEQGERVRVILRQLLDFSRPPQIERAPIDLAEVVRQVVELVSAQPEFGEIEFEIRVEPGAGLAWGDSSIASQVLLNLALNAASAMRDSRERRIRFEIAGILRRRRQGEGADDENDHGRTDSIECRVLDSGAGIELDDPERIFDPFFTTKAPGEGTGLGLANARRLAQELGGSVELDRAHSELGGALFRFVLGAASEATPEASTSSEESRTQSRMP